MNLFQASYSGFSGPTFIKNGSMFHSKFHSKSPPNFTPLHSKTSLYQLYYASEKPVRRLKLIHDFLLSGTLQWLKTSLQNSTPKSPPNFTPLQDSTLLIILCPFYLHFYMRGMIPVYKYRIHLFSRIYGGHAN